MLCLPYAALLAALASAASIPETNSNNHLKMDFSVLRGNSRSTAKKGAREGLVARDDLYTLELTNQLSFYSSTLKIGSNGDENTVLVDTGSSDLWVMSSDVACYPSPLSKRYVEELSPVYYENQNSKFEKRDSQSVSLNATPTTTSTSTESVATINAGNCTSFGSFNTGASESFKFNSSALAFQIEYNDGTFAKGIWGSDTVSIGSLTVPETNLAVVNDTTSEFGVFGIGLPGLEVTSASATKRKNRYTYQNFPIRLKNTGVINKIAYSLYLNDVEASSGSVLFGAVDHAKYSGQLQTVPILNIHKSFANPIAFHVSLDSIALEDSSQNVPVSESPIAALLDSGTTLTYLPPQIVSSFANLLNGKDSQYGFYEVDCVYNTSSAFASYNLSGVNIRVPLSDLIMSPAVAGTNDSKCYLGLVKSPNNRYTGAPTCILGDNFLRHAYVVYDLEQYEISLAQVKYTNDEDIEVISSNIPSAVRAPGYTSTSLASSIVPEPTNSLLTFATTTSYWTGFNTSTTTLSPSGSIPTVVVEIPFTSTSTSTWGGSYTTTEIVTGTDGFETPVVVIPFAVSSSAVSSSVVSSSVVSSSVVSSSVVVSSGVASSAISYASFVSESSAVAPSLGWNASYVATSISMGIIPESSSSFFSSIETADVSSASASITASIKSSFSSLSSLTTETGVVVSTVTNSVGVTELVTSIFTTTYCPATAASAVPSSVSSNSSSLTTETQIVVSTSTNASGSTVLVTNTFTTIYCPVTSSLSATNVGVSSSLTTETNVVVSSSVNASGSTVLATNTFTTTYCPVSSVSTTALATYVTGVSTGGNSGVSQGNSSVPSSTVTPVDSASAASTASSSAPITGGKISSTSQGQAALTTSSHPGAATSVISSSSLSTPQASSITVLQGGSQALTILSTMLLMPLFALL